MSIANGGLIVATYSNGQQATVGQIALASHRATRTAWCGRQ